MLASQFLVKDTAEDRIAELVDAIKRSPEHRDRLVELLPERHPLYAGRSTNETIRIRGYILAAFEQVGLPEAAVPYVLEELENGRDAYSVAAAAKAMRGFNGPAGDFVSFLFKAVENIKYMDDAVTFEKYKPSWPIADYTTALNEIFRSFEWLGPQAQHALSGLEALYHNQSDFSAMTRQEIKSAIDVIQATKATVHHCCHSTASISDSFVTFARDNVVKVHSVAGIELEDQAYRRTTYGEFFSEKPSIVVFFYTRCNNPNKCSLTVTKLGKLQQAIREQGLEGQLKTAAITYDPGYDLPARLTAYGENRGVVFGDDHRFLRTPQGLEELQGFFDLGVNYGGSSVNRHRIELFILDGQGRIAETFSRLQWDIGEVLDHAKAFLQAGALDPQRPIDLAHTANRTPLTWMERWEPATLPVVEPLEIAAGMGCGCGCGGD